MVLGGIFQNIEGNEIINGLLLTMGVQLSPMFAFLVTKKKTNNLWLPIILHFFINVCALPYCFSSISGYANLTLYIILPTYLLLGIYSMNIIKQEKME